MKRSCAAKDKDNKMRRQSQSGFSLIELMIVVAIIGIIASIAIPNMLASKRAGNEASAQSSMRTISSCEQAYFHTYGNGSYADLATLGARVMTDSVLSSGNKSGYHFEVTPEANQYWASAFPVTSSGIGQTGTRRFAITEDSVLRGDVDLSSGAPTDHASALLLPAVGN
jgi:prepilin-type N-terminal cleavage/methylation domain-containing protein